MPDTITLTSTTDPEAAVRAALELPTEAAGSPTLPTEKPVPPAKPAPPPVPEPEPEEEETPVVADAPADQMAGARRKKGRLQSRIDELTTERNRVAAEHAASSAENMALRRRVQELAAGAAPRPEPRQQQAVAPPARPAVDDFATYEDYTEAVAKWAVQVARSEWKKEATDTVDQRLRAESDRAYQTRMEQHYVALTKRYQEGVSLAREKYTDYDDAIGSPELQASKVMEAELLQSPIGPEITYYLATHPETCKRLYAMGDTPQALREFGKVEARVEHALAKAEAEAAAAPTAARRTDAAEKSLASVAPPAGTARRATRAPDPITPVGGGEQQATTDPDKMSYQDYKAWRNAQERRKYGR